MNEILNFGIDYMKVLEEDEYILIAEMYVVSVGANRHNTFIGESAINNALPTLANKPMCCIWDGYDFKEHSRSISEDKQRDCIGVIPQTNMGEIIEYKDKRFLKVRIAFWKYYYPEMIKKIAQNSIEGKETKLSMEIMVEKSFKRDDGLIEIAKFKFMGVSLIGETYRPAIADSRIDVIKFSTEEYETLVSDTNKRLNVYSVPREIKENVSKALEMKQSNSKLKDIALEISESDIMTFAKIEWILNKINSLRKEDNILFYGGKEMKELAENIVNGDIKNYSKKGDFVMEETKIDATDTKVDCAETPAIDEMVDNEETKTNAEEVKAEDPQETKDFSIELEKANGKLLDITAKYEDVLANFTTLTNDYEKLNAELTELKEYKFAKEKDELENMAKSRYDFYSDYVTADEKVELDKVLFTVGYDQFNEKLSALVLPKVEAKLSMFSKETKDVDVKVEFTSVPNIADIQKDEKPMGLWDRLKSYSN